MPYAILMGVAAALLATGWGMTLGGGLALGRLDPAFSLPGRILFGAALAVVLRNRSRVDVLIAVMTMLAVSFAIDALLGALLAGRFAWEQAVLALAVQATAWAAVQAALAYSPQRSPLIARAGIAILAFASALAAAWLIPALYAPSATGERPRVAVLSGVPIEWRGPVDMATILNDTAEASPLLPALADRFDIVRLDAIDAVRLAGVDVLMLAHPRPLSPAELVEIDRWVRDGGRVIILVDAQLSWPPDYPLGDRRNPPITTLLSPLLDHWGLNLGPPAKDESDVFMAGEYRIYAVSMGRFSADVPNCTVALAGRTAECRLGRGRAVLIADADLLNPILWAGKAHSPARWREGNVDWIIGLIRDLAQSDNAELLAPSWRLPSPR